MTGASYASVHCVLALISMSACCSRLAGSSTRDGGERTNCISDLSTSRIVQKHSGASLGPQKAENYPSKQNATALTVANSLYADVLYWLTGPA